MPIQQQLFKVAIELMSLSDLARVVTFANNSKFFDPTLYPRVAQRINHIMTSDPVKYDLTYNATVRSQLLHSFSRAGYRNTDTLRHLSESLQTDLHSGREIVGMLRSMMILDYRNDIFLSRVGYSIVGKSSWNKLYKTANLLSCEELYYNSAIISNNKLPDSIRDTSEQKNLLTKSEIPSSYISKLESSSKTKKVETRVDEIVVDVSHIKENLNKLQIGNDHKVFPKKFVSKISKVDHRAKFVEKRDIWEEIAPKYAATVLTVFRYFDIPIYELVQRLIKKAKRKKFEPFITVTILSSLPSTSNVLLTSNITKYTNLYKELAKVLQINLISNLKDVSSSELVNISWNCLVRHNVGSAPFTLQLCDALQRKALTFQPRAIVRIITSLAQINRTPSVEQILIQNIIKTKPAVSTLTRLVLEHYNSLASNDIYLLTSSLIGLNHEAERAIYLFKQRLIHISQGNTNYLWQLALTTKMTQLSDLTEELALEQTYIKSYKTLYESYKTGKENYLNNTNYEQINLISKSIEIEDVNSSLVIPNVKQTQYNQLIASNEGKNKFVDRCISLAAKEAERLSEINNALVSEKSMFDVLDDIESRRTDLIKLKIAKNTAKSYLNSSAAALRFSVQNKITKVHTESHWTQIKTDNDKNLILLKSTLALCYRDISGANFYAQNIIKNIISNVKPSINSYEYFWFILAITKKAEIKLNNRFLLYLLDHLNVLEKDEIANILILYSYLRNKKLATVNKAPFQTKLWNKITNQSSEASDKILEVSYNSSSEPNLQIENTTSSNSYPQSETLDKKHIIDLPLKSFTNLTERDVDHIIEDGNKIPSWISVVLARKFGDWLPDDKSLKIFYETCKDLDILLLNTKSNVVEVQEISSGTLK